MSDVLHTASVLSLNAIYQRTGFRTVAEAFTAMMGGDGKNAPALAINVVYKNDSYGNPDPNQIDYWVPVTFDEWLALPIRPCDKAIRTTKYYIRVPTIIVCPHFDKPIMKKKKATPSAIRERDGNRCQYTGVPLTNKTFSLDHVIPKSRGGKHNAANLVAAHKDVNSKKGNKFNHEIGLKLLKQPADFKQTPLSATIRGNRHPDHALFPNPADIEQRPDNVSF